MNTATDAAMSLAQERRASKRRTVIHPAKVYDQRADKYYPAETCNLSDDGALLKINRTMPISRGDTLDIGMATTDTGAVISREGFVTARVVRVTSIDRFSQAVAVQFTAAVPLLLAA